VSAVNADSYDPDGKIIPQIYKALTRRERHEELIRIRDRRRRPAGQARVRHCRRQGRDQHQRVVGNGRRAACAARRARAHARPRRRRDLRRGHAVQAVRDRGVLQCQLSADRQLRPRFPRAVEAGLFQAAEWLSAVVYEDPWLAGGHNGLSNAEDPLVPQDPYPRVKELRRDDARRAVSPTACRS